MTPLLKLQFDRVLLLILAAGASAACVHQAVANGREPENEPTRWTSAPVPKQKPRGGVIVIVPGYARTPARLFTTDGDVIGELPFDDVSSCSLSPDGTQMAVVVREKPPVNAPQGTVSRAVYVAALDADPTAIGKLIAVGLNYPVLAWAPDGKSLYVSDRLAPPKLGILRPAGVTVYDLVKGSKTEEKGLKEYYVTQVSADAKRFLARRVVTQPKELCETAVLDAVTRKPVDVGAGGIELTYFLGENRMLGTRPKPKGAPDEMEHVLFDLKAKTASPLPLPKEVLGDTAEIYQVLPSPDGKQVLYVWGEEVPAPVDWPARVPCRAARMTTSDLHGGHARTIFKPVIKVREDQVRNHIGHSVDWR